MASFRRLPSGLWQAAVRLPDGRRITRTDALKSVVKTWATATEADARRGVWRDPRRTDAPTLTEWHARWQRGRAVEAETARADESSWRLHLAPELGDVVVAELRRVDVEAWAKGRVNAGVGPGAVRRALNYLKAMLEAAVDNDVVTANVARKVAPPSAPKRAPMWFTLAQFEKITAQMREAGWEAGAVMTELMCWAGLRWGEAAALRRDDVDVEAGVVTVSHVLTQAGKDKAYPKTSSSTRRVPVPAWVLERMVELVGERGPSARVFVTRRGGRDLSGSNWRTDFIAAREGAGVGFGTPHTCRHTCASWLVQQGVPLYEVARQLGHASVQTTQIYAHLAPDAHRSVTGAWGRLGAPATHERIVQAASHA